MRSLRVRARALALSLTSATGRLQRWWFSMRSALSALISFRVCVTSSVQLCDDTRSENADDAQRIKGERRGNATRSPSCAITCVREVNARPRTNANMFQPRIGGDHHSKQRAHGELRQMNHIACVSYSLLKSGFDRCRICGVWARPIRSYTVRNSA